MLATFFSLWKGTLPLRALCWGLWWDFPGSRLWLFLVPDAEDANVRITKHLCVFRSSCNLGRNREAALSPTWQRHRPGLPSPAPIQPPQRASEKPHGKHNKLHSRSSYFYTAKPTPLSALRAAVMNDSLCFTFPPSFFTVTPPHVLLLGWKHWPGKISLAAWKTVYLFRSSLLFFLMSWTC